MIALPSVFGKPPHLAMTIICCLPSLPVEVFWHLLTPSPALYLRLFYDSRRAASTCCRLGSRAERLTTLSPVHAFMLARSAFSIQACVQSYPALGKRDDSWVARSSSRNVVSFSSACTSKRFLSPRCASAIQITHRCKCGRRQRNAERSEKRALRFDCAASGSSCIRVRADLASHSPAFCRSSEALRSASFSLLRIWCVLIVLMLALIHSLNPSY